MSQERRATEWQVISESETGAAHVKSGLPNQDKSYCYRFDNLSSVVLAVADGHGSPKSFRSHIGAAFAVNVAGQIGREFISSLECESASRVKSQADQRLAINIINTWKQRVSDHVKEHPFTIEELDRLEMVAGKTARDTVESNTEHAYGSTLIATFVTERYLLFFQLGDGEIIIADSSSHHISRPISRDLSLIANETPSLCLGKDAMKFARTEFKYVHDALPAMILLSTDGFPNAMPNDEAFLRFVGDLSHMLDTSGVDAVRQEMPGWLKRATAEGSGDDVTVGILFRSATPELQGGERDLGVPDNKEKLHPAARMVAENSMTLEARSPEVAEGDEEVPGIKQDVKDEKMRSHDAFFAQHGTTPVPLETPQISLERGHINHVSPPQDPKD